MYYLLQAQKVISMKFLLLESVRLRVWNKWYSFCTRIR